MGEAVGHHVALPSLLQRVVADRGGGGQRLLDVACLEQSLSARVWFAQMPAKQSACSSVLHRDRVGLGLADRCWRCARRQDAEHVLHVVADLVREHVGLREIAGRAEALAQLVVEAEVDVEVLVGRAVERPGRGAGKPQAEFTLSEKSVSVGSG